jgi:hypothetical protein
MDRDLLKEHYLAHKEHAVDINTYRGQGLTVLASGFAPVAGSLIAVAATGKFPEASRFALIVSLIAFALITIALAFWAGRLDALQRQYRKAMDELVSEDIDELVELREDSLHRVVREDVLILRGPVGSNRASRLLFGHGFLPPTLLTLAAAAIVLVALLASNTIQF